MINWKYIVYVLGKNDDSKMELTRTEDIKGAVEVLTNFLEIIENSNISIKSIDIYDVKNDLHNEIVINGGK